MSNKLSQVWSAACDHASVHREAYHHLLHASHVSYLGTVVFHGPYSVAAGLCMIVLVIGYLFRLEIPDVKALPQIQGPSNDLKKSQVLSPAPSRLG